APSAPPAKVLDRPTGEVFPAVPETVAHDAVIERAHPSTRSPVLPRVASQARELPEMDVAAEAHRPDTAQVERAGKAGWLGDAHGKEIELGTQAFFATAAVGSGCAFPTNVEALDRLGVAGDGGDFLRTGIAAAIENETH